MHRLDETGAATVPRLAIVTGAGSGLGRAFCRALAASGGWHIVAVDVDAPAVEETLADVRQLTSIPGQVELMDVADANAWTSLRDQLRRDWPRLDLLINNAGVCMAAEVGKGSLDQWRRVHEVNYLGVLYGCHAMAPWLREAPEARSAVINVASIAAFLSGPAMGAYCASKAAVVALSEAMYAELRPWGVGVTVVTPGFFRTQLLVNGQFCSPRHRAQAEKLARAARFTAEDVARAALAGATQGRLYVAVGARARWLWRCKRLAPRMLQRIIARRYHQTFGEER